jgi:hypothetical protein
VEPSPLSILILQGPKYSPQDIIFIYPSGILKEKLVIEVLPSLLIPVPGRNKKGLPCRGSNQGHLHLKPLYHINELSN